MATDYWYPEQERSVLWSDPAIAIDWTVAAAPRLSAKDSTDLRLADADLFA